MTNSYRYDYARRSPAERRDEYQRRSAAAFASKPWTPEEDDAAATLWRAGESASVVGKALNRTRNSVVSRMHRLKVATPASPNASGLPKYNPKTPKAARTPRPRPQLAAERRTSEERKAQLKAEKVERQRAAAIALWSDPARAAPVQDCPRPGCAASAASAHRRTPHTSPTHAARRR